MSPGGGELSLSVCPGVGNRTSSTQMPGGVPGGEMVTGRIEPRIIKYLEDEITEKCLTVCDVTSFPRSTRNFRE